MENLSELAIATEQWSNVLFGLFVSIAVAAIAISRTFFTSKISQNEERLKIENETKQQIIEDQDFKNLLIQQLHQANLDENKAYREHVQEQFKVKDEEILRFKTKTEDLQNQLDYVKQELISAKTEANRVPALVDNIDKLQKQIDDISNRFQRILRENTNLSLNLQTREALLNQKDAEITTLKIALQTSEDEVILLKAKITRLEHEIEVLKQL